MPDISDDSPVRPFLRLIDIITELRGENGCPWDKKQSPQSIKKYLRDECEELIDAIEIGNIENICEETGDIFFVLLLLVAVYEEQKSFSLEEALVQICEKMVRRHPHVFSGEKITSEKQLKLQWERIKAMEKQKTVPPAAP